MILLTASALTPSLIYLPNCLLNESSSSCSRLRIYSATCKPKMCALEKYIDPDIHIVLFRLPISKRK